MRLLILLFGDSFLVEGCERVLAAGLLELGLAGTRTLIADENVLVARDISVEGRRLLLTPFNDQRTVLLTDKVVLNWLVRDSLRDTNGSCVGHVVRHLII